MSNFNDPRLIRFKPRAKKYIIPKELHKQISIAIFTKAGYHKDEAIAAHEIAFAAEAAGSQTHGLLKLASLDQHFGTGVGKWTPQAEIIEQASSYQGILKWDAQRKFGPAVAMKAVTEGTKLASEHGQAMISVAHATHFLNGGVIARMIAERGFVAEIMTTAGTSEAVPFGGGEAAYGTNPITKAYPSQNSLGFIISIDLATSAIPFGLINLYRRDVRNGLDRKLPEGVAFDENGKCTTDPLKAVSVAPLAEHKGYILGLINEFDAALIGCGNPKIRGRVGYDENTTANFCFRITHPDAYRVLTGTCSEDFKKVQTGLNWIIWQKSKCYYSWRN